MGAQKKAQAALQFYPMFPKTAVAVGKQASVPGKFWSGCPAADKLKRFLCRVVQFIGLAVWTSIGVNYSTFAPGWKKILERYMLKFSKGGKAKLHEDDLGLLSPGSTEEASGPCIEVDEDSD